MFRILLPESPDNMVLLILPGSTNNMFLLLLPESSGNMCLLLLPKCTGNMCLNIYLRLLSICFCYSTYTWEYCYIYPWEHWQYVSISVHLPESTYWPYVQIYNISVSVVYLSVWFLIYVGAEFPGEVLSEGVHLDDAPQLLWSGLSVEGVGLLLVSYICEVWS